MNHEQYIKNMSTIGYSREEAEDQIWLARNSSNLVLRTFNFLPVGDGIYEIWISGDRDDFFPVSANGETFRGTLSDAYEYVFQWAKE